MKQYHYKAPAKREVWIDPMYANITVGDRIVVRPQYSSQRDIKATVIKSSKQRFTVEGTYASGKAFKMSFSKVTGQRVTADKYDRETIARTHNPNTHLKTWEELDADNQAEAERKHRESLERRLNNFSWDRRGLSEEQLNEAIALIESFGKEV